MPTRVLTAGTLAAGVATLIMSSLLAQPQLATVPQFQDVTAASGLAAFTLTTGSLDKRYILETTAGGVAFLDYDNDGWLDVFLVNGSTIDGELKHTNAVSDRLYRNNHNLTFTDVTQAAGLLENRWGQGVAVADVNNDGFDDLFVTNFGQNALYLNTGKGTFRDATAQSGLGKEQMWSAGAAFGDYDGDGDVDLYVSTYIDFDLAHPPDFDSMPGTAKQNCLFRSLRVFCGPLGLRPSTDRFYENLGSGRFADLSQASGIASVPPAYGMGVVWLDANEDGKPDLYVANDRNPNYLFLNNGDKTFTETGMLSGAAVSAAARAQAGMGIDVGDYDNDGRLDLAVTNFADDYNTIYHAEGSGHFADATLRTGTVSASYPFVGWGTKFFDADNDGWLDWIVANGHVFPQIDGQQTIYGNYAYKQPALLFRNAGNGSFQDVSASSRVAAAPRRSNRGLAVGDVDNDGRVDVMLSALDEGPTLLRNLGPAGNWLTLSLKGTASNRSAIGARLTIRTGTRTQTRQIMSGDSYLSQSDRRVHVGLGSAAAADQITITWPSGQRQTLTNLAANRIVQVTEPPASSGSPRSPPGRP